MGDLGVARANHGKMLPVSRDVDKSRVMKLPNREGANGKKQDEEGIMRDGDWGFYE